MIFGLGAIFVVFPINCKAIFRLIRNYLRGKIRKQTNKRTDKPKKKKKQPDILKALSRVVDMMWRMALARSLARLVDSCKLFFDFRLLSAFDSFWRVIHKRNGDLCC